MAEIEPFHVMLIIARAKELEAQGRNIVNMVVGEPDFPIAPLVQQAGIRVLQAGHLHYTPALGITPLREAISAWYRTRYGVRGAGVARNRHDRVVGCAAAHDGRAARSGRSGAAGRSGLSVQPSLRARAWMASRSAFQSAPAPLIS